MMMMAEIMKIIMMKLVTDENDNNENNNNENNDNKNNNNENNDNKNNENNDRHPRNVNLRSNSLTRLPRASLQVFSTFAHFFFFQSQIITI